MITVETFETRLRDWSCKQSSLVEKDHGHIIRDLGFIENNPVRKQISKGISFGEAGAISGSRCKDVITKWIKACSKFHLLIKYKIKISKSRKNEIAFHIDKKTSMLKQKVKPKKTNSVLQRHNAMEYLQKIETRFVLIPIDKAAIT